LGNTERSKQHESKVILASAKEVSEVTKEKHAAGRIDHKDIGTD
jgi:hypothetical protein